MSERNENSKEKKNKIKHSSKIENRMFLNNKTQTKIVFWSYILQTHAPGATKLWPTGQIQSTTHFYK